MNKKDTEMYRNKQAEFGCHCAFCYNNQVQMHHVFGGPNRPKSTKYGLVIPLCAQHHLYMLHGNMTWGDAKKKLVANNPFNWTSENDNELVSQLLRKEYQKKFEKEHPNLSFLKIFGRNYL